MRDSVSSKEKLSYGGYVLGQNIIIIMSLQFLLIFYTDYVGLTAGAIGVIFLVARVWDAINDPIMGAIVDKLKLKGGKFKPWVNLTIVLLPLATILLFQDFGGSYEFRFTYAFITYIIWGMIYTIGDIPIFALATVMSKDVDERVKIISIGRLLGGIGSLVGVVLFTPLSDFVNYSFAATVLAVIAFLVMIPVKYYTMERVVYDRSNKHNLKSMATSIYKNKYLLIFYVVVILTNVTNSSTATAVHFVKYNLGNEMLVPILSLAAASSMIIMPIILPSLIEEFGKRKIFITLMIISIISSVAFYFIGYDNIYLVFIFIALKFLAINLPIVMMGMFTADCLEYDYYHNKVRNEGVIFSVQTFAVKITIALQGIIGAFALENSNFVPNQEQTQETLNEMWRMTTLYPIIGQVIAVIVFYLLYNLKESDVKQMTIKNAEGSV